MKSCRVMKAVRVSEFGGPEVLKLLSDVPVPTPGRRQVSGPPGGADRRDSTPRRVELSLLNTRPHPRVRYSHTSCI